MVQFQFSSETRDKAQRILWDVRLQKEAAKLEKEMSKVNEDVTKVDELERTFYLTKDAGIVDDLEEMKFVDEVTTEITSVPTFSVIHL